MTRLAPWLALALLLTGCEFLRSARAPISAWHLQHDPRASRSCLLVFLPGIGDSTDDFTERGAVARWADGERRCDLVLVDAHFSYYREGNLSERVREDVLERAVEEGYREVWLVGFSIGGYGALWVARENPGLVQGIVLIAPMIGVPPRAAAAAREVRAAGGVRAFRPVLDGAPPHHFREPRVLWAWLGEALREPATHPPIYLAYGESDPSVDAMQLLSESLPAERVHRAPGGHDWETWSGLLEALFAAPPWGAGATPPSAP